MFNATQTYKDRLIARLERELEDDSWMYASGITAFNEVIHIIQENDIPPVMQEPIKTK